MTTLTLQRCLNHPAREAAARCPECAQPYCRECVSEHEGRVLCVACLRKLTKQTEAGVSWLRKFLAAAQVASALLVLWLLFFALGRILLAIPASFHEGDLWKPVTQQR